MRRTLFIVCTFAVFGCTAIQQQKSQPPAADDLHFRNLQVLPQNISRDELVTTMRRFAQGLGVGCDYCHAAATPVAGQQPQLDFPSDAKREKDTARMMIRMTNRINDETIARVPDAHTTVSCWTCHRGEAQPEVVPSLPPQRQQAAHR